MTFGSHKLQRVLMMVMRIATMDSH